MRAPPTTKSPRSPRIRFQLTSHFDLSDLSYDPPALRTPEVSPNGAPSVIDSTLHAREAHSSPDVPMCATHSSSHATRPADAMGIPPRERDVVTEVGHLAAWKRVAAAPTLPGAAACEIEGRDTRSGATVVRPAGAVQSSATATASTCVMFLFVPDVAVVLPSYLLTSISISVSIAATSVTACEIPATVVMLGKLVEINCLLTASVLATGVATFLITLLLASHLSSESRKILSLALSTASCDAWNVWIAELSKSSSVNTEPDAKSTARVARSVVRSTCTKVPVAGPEVNSTVEL